MTLTAIVVTYNEERRLDACLKSLKFCSQLIVVDIGSNDRCVEIARACGADVITHSWAPIVEEVLLDIIGLSKNDWIIHVDPDEVLPYALAKCIRDTLIGIRDNVGQISLPYQYYFRGKPLSTSVWGGIRQISHIFHRDRVIFSGSVHRGWECKKSFVTQEIEYNGENAIEHYWIDTYQQLWEKHWRYLKFEGKARFDYGERFRLYHLLRETAKAFYISLIRKQGWRGGFTGILLSYFYAWYNFMSVISLAVYQVSHSKLKIK